VAAHVPGDAQALLAAAGTGIPGGKLECLFLPGEKEHPMLRWALVFLIIAIVFAILGFGVTASAFAAVAKIIFYVAIILFVISLIGHLTRRV
jgi:uncharacterized membrane protein YtjA (UPF0391 family)